MPKQAGDVVAELASSARGLNQYLSRIEGLFLVRQLPMADVQRAYSGAFLSFYIALERTIQELFMGILMGRLIVSRPGIRPLVTVRSEVIARKIVRGDRRYVDWLPYNFTRDRANAFFSRGKPFEALTAAEVERLEDVRIIRNALAHGGEHAMAVFQRRFTAGLALPSDQRRPSGYLRGQHGVGQTRFTNLLAQSIVVTRRLV